MGPKGCPRLGWAGVMSHGDVVLAGVPVLEVVRPAVSGRCSSQGVCWGGGLGVCAEVFFS